MSETQPEVVESPMRDADATGTAPVYTNAASMTYAGRGADDQLPPNRLVNENHPEFTGYATALAAYEARADVENLADRRDREVAATFTANDDVRARHQA